MVGSLGRKMTSPMDTTGRRGRGHENSPSGRRQDGVGGERGQSGKREEVRRGDEVCSL